MRNIFFIVLFCISSLQAEDILRVNDFEVSLFSKISKAPVQVEMSMIFEGRDVEVYDFKIIDSLNVVVGSFYAENLLTSKGKEGLKEAIIAYTKDKYQVDIDNIYIQKLSIVKDITAKVIIDELRREGYIKR